MEEEEEEEVSAVWMDGGREGWRDGWTAHSLQMRKRRKGDAAAASPSLQPAEFITRHEPFHTEQGWGGWTEGSKEGSKYAWGG